MRARREPKNKAKKLKIEKPQQVFFSRVRPDYPRFRSATWIFMCGHTHDMVIYSLFHRNPFRGFAAPGGQNLAFAITLAIAFTTTCTTVQAVIVTREHSVQHIPTSCHMLIPASSTQDNLNPNSNDNPNFQKLINHFLVRTLFLSSKFHGGPLITCRLSCSRTNRQTS